MDNGTWHLEKLPSGCLTIPCQWIFNVKYHSDGSIDRYKARLVALGNHQEYGVDYDEVYSPVARFESLRLFLLSAALRMPTSFKWMCVRHS